MRPCSRSSAATVPAGPAGLTRCPPVPGGKLPEYQGQKLVNRFDANTYLYSTRALDLFDVSKGYGSLDEALGRIQCPTLVVGVTSDILYPVYQQLEIVAALQRRGRPVEYAEIDSPHGHDGFLIDFHMMEPVLARFLARLR